VGDHDLPVVDLPKHLWWVKGINPVHHGVPTDVGNDGWPLECKGVLNDFSNAMSMTARGYCCHFAGFTT
jgi:hypothetical protein